MAQPSVAQAIGTVSARVLGITDQNGVFYPTKTVILGTGTFLKGLLHCGLNAVVGGRRGEAPANHLSDALRRLGFQVGRLKTGTPMRLDGSTIEYSKCQIQPGDANPIQIKLIPIQDWIWARAKTRTIRADAITARQENG